MLQSMGLQRVRHNLATERQQGTKIPRAMGQLSLCAAATEPMHSGALTSQLRPDTDKNKKASSSLHLPAMEAKWKGLQVDAREQVEKAFSAGFHFSEYGPPSPSCLPHPSFLKGQLSPLSCHRGCNCHSGL